MVRFLSGLVALGLLFGSVACSGRLVMDWTMTIDGDMVRAVAVAEEVDPR